MTATDAAPDDQTLDAGRMTIWEHLAELRDRIVRCAIAIGVGALAGWFLFDVAFNFLLAPYRAFRPDARLIVTGPLQGFSLRLEMAVYMGIIFAMPVILWQIWRFVTPGLYAQEKRYAIPFVSAALVLFLFGVAVAYFTLNPALQFLSGVTGDNFEELFQPNEYVKLIAFMMLAFGIGFEFPVLLIALQLAGALTYQKLAGWRRPAAVIIVIVAAVITPSGDPISMLALAVPMYIFYEISIIFGWFLTRRKLRNADAT